MKKICLLSIMLPILMILIPLPTMKNVSFESVEISGGYLYNEAENISVSNAVTDSFLLYDHKSGNIEKISAEDYIFGVLAAEMPALYETEALKAQAVAAYTFACRRKYSSNNKGYDISTDYTVDQAYITEEDARKKWGDDADKYVEKLRNVVKETAGYVVTYKGNIALTVYHSVSSGRTEKASDIWGGNIEYLVSVDSSGDRLADNYLSTATFTAQEFSEKLKSLCEFSSEAEKWLGKSSCTDSGHVKSIEICGKEVSGSDVRSALTLPSSTFDISFRDGVFTVVCKGYGHGVGMSQYGANIMAQQGSDFKEILCHYYTGCKVEKAE